MKSMKAHLFALGLTLASLSLTAGRIAAEDFPPEQIAKGAKLFSLHCQTCHGTRMRNPQWGANLKLFPKDGRDRFVDTVTYGKRNMPPWDDVLNEDDIGALWSYVTAGEPEGAAGN